MSERVFREDKTLDLRFSRFFFFIDRRSRCKKVSEWVIDEAVRCQA